MEQNVFLHKDELFQVVFLGDNDWIVDVVETRDIDFEEVLACVKLGGSVFITSKLQGEVQCG